MASASDDDEDVWQDGSMRLSRADSGATGSSGYLTATDGSVSDSNTHKVGGGGELSTPSTSMNSRLTKPGGEVSTPSTPAASRRTQSGDILTPSTSAASRRTKSGIGIVTPSTSGSSRRMKPSGEVSTSSTLASRRTKSETQRAGDVSTPSVVAASRRTKSDIQRAGDVSTPSTLASRRTKSDTQRAIPALYASNRIQRLAKQRNEFVGSELEFEIEASKDHWTDLSPELLNGNSVAGQESKKIAQQNKSGGLESKKILPQQNKSGGLESKKIAQQNKSGSLESKKIPQQNKSGGLVENGGVVAKNTKSRSSCGRVVKEFCGYLRIVNRKKNGEDPTSNRAVFETLRKNPQWAKFLEPFGNSVSASERKIAEGAQAEIFESSGFTVYKVFKSPLALRDLHEQWPNGMLVKGKQIYSMAHALGVDMPVSISEMMPSMSSGTYFHELNTAGSFGGVLLEDGRFALVMKKYDGDLRTLIDARMLQNGNQGPPFGYETAKWMMRQIAVGMNGLHRDRIVHRDLKASNVLYEVSGVGGIDLVVADFECSARVLGTGFWRAPEILKALPDVPAHAFSEKSDVYSYAMTCYEILTGCLPFEDQLTSEVGVVVREGPRPVLPAYIEPSVRDLIASCWHENPANRPAFGVILKTWREICV